MPRMTMFLGVPCWIDSSCLRMVLTEKSDSSSSAEPPLPPPDVARSDEERPSSSSESRDDEGERSAARRLDDGSGGSPPPWSLGSAAAERRGEPARAMLDTLWSGERAATPRGKGRSAARGAAWVPFPRR